MLPLCFFVSLELWLPTWFPTRVRQEKLLWLQQEVAQMDLHDKVCIDLGRPQMDLFSRKLAVLAGVLSLATPGSCMSFLSGLAFVHALLKVEGTLFQVQRAT